MRFFLLPSSFCFESLSERKYSSLVEHASTSKKVCDYVRIAAKSGVTKDIKQKGDYAGFPAQSSKAWKEQIVVSRMLTRQMKLAKFRDAS